MIDIVAEDTRTFDEAAKIAKVSFCTLWRWALKGLPGADGRRVRLRAARLGGRWLTSIRALQEFCEATTPRFDDDAILPPRTATARQKASEKAAKELGKVGI